MRSPCSIIRLLALGAALAFAAPAAAQDVPPEAPKLAEDIHETIVKLPVAVTLLSGKQHSGQMLVTHFRPNGDGPFPVVIFNHGRTAAKEKRAATPRFRYTSVARFWVRRGFAVFVPTRLGYGDAGLEPDPEFSGNACDDRRFEIPIAAMTKQIAATLEFAKSFPWADTKRVIVMGQSYGGMASVAVSAEKLPGVVAAINFAGGGGGDPQRRPGQPCSPSRLASIYGDIGKKAGTPMLWLYAENDKYWGADWPKTWHAAYAKAGGRAQLATFPAVGDDGHNLLGRGFRLWRPVVDEFVAKQGFRVPAKSKGAPPATSFARIDDADKIPLVKNEVKTDGYQKFLDADVPRAFAIGPKGSWSWRTGENAPADALARCEQLGKQPCKLYAVDDAVVWKP